MSDQILAKHPSQLTLNTTPLQKLVMDLNESEEECLSGGESLETLKRFQDAFKAELNLRSSSDIFLLIL